MANSYNSFLIFHKNWQHYFRVRDWPAIESRWNKELCDWSGNGARSFTGYIKPTRALEMLRLQMLADLFIFMSLVGKLSCRPLQYHVNTRTLPSSRHPPLSVSTCKDAGGIRRQHCFQRGTPSSFDWIVGHKPLRNFRQWGVCMLWQGTSAGAQLQPGIVWKQTHYWLVSVRNVLTRLQKQKTVVFYSPLIDLHLAWTLGLCSEQLKKKKKEKCPGTRL